MFSLFISFDTFLSYLNPFFFLFIFLLLLSFRHDFFYAASKKSVSLMILLQSIKSEILEASKISSELVLMFFFSLFFFILMVNFMGMVTFVFTLSGHTFFCFFYSFSFWLTAFIFSSYSNTLNFYSHLVPLGSPLVLSQFMVLIETISQFIRPLTLGVRLMANLTAGHLILILCSSSFVFFSYTILPLILLTILELVVAAIQSYVFIILLSMYFGEFNK